MIINQAFGRHLQDVLSVFAGLWQLVRAGSGRATSALARDHLLGEESGLVSIAGGKWTIYREMAELATDAAAPLPLPVKQAMRFAAHVIRQTASRI